MNARYNRDTYNGSKWSCRTLGQLSREMVNLSFITKKETQHIKLNKQQGDWLAGILPKLSVANLKTYTLQEVKESYEASGLEDFELFWDNKPVSNLYKVGLLRL